MRRKRASDQPRSCQGAVKGRRQRWVRPTVLVLEGRMLLSNYPVTSTADTNTSGTLRYAINQLDASGTASNTITFGIIPSGVQTIILTSALPSITKPVDIEGNTEPGFQSLAGDCDLRLVRD